MELKGKILLKYQRIERAQSLELDERPLDEISDVTELKGIGKGVAEVINDYRETGESQYLQQLQEEVPERLFHF